MKIKKVGFKGLSALSFGLVVGAGVMMMVYPQAALDGVCSGVELCLNVAVPSLFPFLAVSIFVSGCSASKSGRGVAYAIMKALFRLPADAACAILSGLVGGYPVGCAVTAELYEQGRLTREQAQRMTLFCINPGPAFAITAVGTVMMGSRRTGAVIYASLCISSLLIGVMLRFVSQEPMPVKIQESQRRPVSVRLVEATEKAAVSMLKICAWITLFSCLFSLIKELGFSDGAMAVIRCVFEATGGCRAASAYGNIYTVTATAGWSGLCVICQVLGDVRKVGTPLVQLLAFRALHAALSSVVCRILLTLFPVSVSTFVPLAADTAVEMFSFSAPAALALLGLCTVFVIDLDRNKKMC